MDTKTSLQGSSYKHNTQKTGSKVHVAIIFYPYFFPVSTAQV